MSTEILLAIIGTFGTLALSINAFFLRGIYKDLNEVKIALARMGENSKGKEHRIESLEENQKDIFERLRNLEVNP